MAYVDLNPIRAGMADSPEQSDFTSIKTRIETIHGATTETQPDNLFPFIGHERLNEPEGLPFQLMDYLELVDWTGRCIREDKRGAIHQDLPPILQRLHITLEQWQKLSQQFEHNFKHFAGGSEQLKSTCRILGYQRSPGMANCKSLLN